MPNTLEWGGLPLHMGQHGKRHERGSGGEGGTLPTSKPKKVSRGDFQSVFTTGMLLVLSCIFEEAKLQYEKPLQYLYKC